jgi:EAL domain-containing protein (putative c-di-GMP-specific phosphodiesterase class I)
LRWQSKSLGTVCPTEFIAVAEQHSVILDIGRWVIKRVVEHLARVKLRHPDFQVSINLSARQLDDVDLPGFISRTVAKAGLSPRSLQFELTETWLIRNAAAAKSFLARLKELGFTIALDDFGVGYSSLAYLAQFPVDVVKLDRSFVERLPESETACVVAASVLDLSRRLRMQTIAEGVETEAQRDFLQAAGCDQAQGWLVAPALPADQFFARFDRSALPVPIGKEFVLG